MPYHPRKSVGFNPFSADTASQDFTSPKSSGKSFTKATLFLNNESLNDVLESDVTTDESFHRLWDKIISLRSRFISPPLLRVSQA